LSPVVIRFREGFRSPDSLARGQHHSHRGHHRDDSRVRASHRPRLDCDLRSAKQMIIETGIGDYIGRLMTDGTSVFV
jgi:hypothetical protein